jgi:hypothetical protein
MTEIFILKIKHVKLFEVQQKRPIFKAHIPLRFTNDGKPAA